MVSDRCELIHPWRCRTAQSRRPSPAHRSPMLHSFHPESGKIYLLVTTAVCTISPYPSSYNQAHPQSHLQPSPWMLHGLPAAHRILPRWVAQPVPLLNAKQVWFPSVCKHACLKCMHAPGSVLETKKDKTNPEKQRHISYFLNYQ